MQGRGWETAGSVTEEQGGRRGWRGDERDAESICVVRNGVAGGGGGAERVARLCQVLFCEMGVAVQSTLQFPPHSPPGGATCWQHLAGRTTADCCRDTANPSGW